MKEASKKRVLVIHNILSPNRTPLFAAMSEWYAEHDIEFRVAFLSASESNRQWSTEVELPFDYIILDQQRIELGKKDVFTFYTSGNITKELDSYTPDVIISFGWDHVSAYKAQSWAKKHRAHFTLWAGSTVHEASWRRTVSTPLVKWFIRRCDSIIAYGTRAKEYVVQLGAKESDVSIFYNSGDVSKLAAAVQQVDATSMKQSLQIEPQDKVIIFNGQLIERKGIFDVLQAVEMLPSEDVHLICVGDGQERAAVEEYIALHHLSQVYLVGFVPYEELAQYYALADVFVLPSHEEVWGLVINEALACNIPVITTNVVGAAPDMISPDKNGIIVSPNNSAELAKAIDSVLYGDFVFEPDVNAEILTKTSIATSIASNILPLPR